ncbi:MAG TPA: hypothetical protein VGN07_06230 [Steroidobacteraceae bacterium]|jgi:hypothetical protein
MFKLLAALLAIYVAQGLASGTIYGKSGTWGRVYRRAEQPSQYWWTIAAYSLLTLALFFIF